MTLMRIGLSAVACLLIASLAGCQPAPAPSTSLPALPASAFDGTYRTTVSVTAVGPGADPRWCQTQAPASLDVVANRFSLSLPHPNVPGNPTPTFAVAVAPDGSFQAPSVDGTASFVGQISGARLRGTVNMAGCQYAVSGDRG
jgi:hypothetical protein